MFISRIGLRCSRNFCFRIFKSQRSQFVSQSKIVATASNRTIVSEHSRRSLSTQQLKMQHSEQEWSGLCQKVKILVPKELGNEAWYLIIVSLTVTNRYGVLAQLLTLDPIRRPPWRVLPIPTCLQHSTLTSRRIIRASLRQSLGKISV
jgi:hypothetical protein